MITFNYSDIAFMSDDEKKTLTREFIKLSRNQHLLVCIFDNSNASFITGDNKDYIINSFFDLCKIHNRKFNSINTKEWVALITTKDDSFKLDKNNLTRESINKALEIDVAKVLAIKI